MPDGEHTSTTLYPTPTSWMSEAVQLNLPGKILASDDPS